MKNNYTDEYITKAAEGMGLSADVKAGGAIYVKSSFGGHWIINECDTGYKLQHENYHLGGSCRRGTYHKHNRIFQDQLTALGYISAHDSRIPFRRPKLAMA